jgi:hypothetical protein
MKNQAPGICPMKKKHQLVTLSKITLLQTRFIRFRDAPYYLGKVRYLLFHGRG